ncbi:MAG TPA: hypothetical protein VK403_04800 [Allosphingosinicella sp.]|nr:hypothetical protein [Allosphingosinicella sp.]
MAVPAMAAQESDAGKPAKERVVCTRDVASHSRQGTKICRSADDRRGTAPAAAAAPKPAEKARTETAAAPAPAGTASPAVQVASATAVTGTEPKKEKKICKRKESTTSRLGAGPMICKTAAEWRRLNGEPSEVDTDKLLMSEGKGR